MGVALGHAVEFRLVVAQGAARCPTAVEWTRPGGVTKGGRTQPAVSVRSRL